MTEPEVRHVFFYGDGEELLALRAPVTELSWMTPKPGIDDTEFRQAVRMGTELFHKDERCKGAAWGMVVEPEALKKMAVYVAGWNTIEVCSMIHTPCIAYLNRDGIALRNAKRSLRHCLIRCMRALKAFRV